MKILHYSLGFPPYRTGGLTKFCMDLMKQQVEDGEQVALLWPGKIGFVKHNVSIKDRGTAIIDRIDTHIQNLELINPLPVSYDEGIKDISSFIYDSGKESYEKLLDNYRPDIIHIHTLMGLHKNLLVTAKEKNIRLVFSAHDFFPICPKVTMFRGGKICDNAQSCSKCGSCNANALGIRKIQLLQSSTYRRWKDSPIVKRMRKQHRDKALSERMDINKKHIGVTENDFKKLREYYYSMLQMMDVIHYNSTLSEKVYGSFFELPERRVIGITHADIKDHRRIKSFSENMLRIRYLGPYGGAKGFFLLKAALDKLWETNKNFRLDIHFKPIETLPYANVHGRYGYGELEKIFADTDVLVVPSIWYETFGYTVLEALSYGVPVIISGTVGAKDILAKGVGSVVENIDAEKLCNTIQKISVQKLKEMNKNIVRDQEIMTLPEMARRIKTECYIADRKGRIKQL